MRPEAPWLWQPPAGSKGATRLQLYNNKHTLTHTNTHWAGTMQVAFRNAADVHIHTPEDARSEYPTSCPVRSCYKVKLPQRAHREKESVCVFQHVTLPLT